MTPTVLAPARQPGESFEVYRSRRRACNRAVKRWLRGNFVWVACGPLPKRKRIMGAYCKKEKQA